MKPKSRIEQYLNALATGDTENLPPKPQSRIEEYLELILNNSISITKQEEITLTGGFKIDVEREGNRITLNILNAATNGEISGKGKLPEWAIPKKAKGGSVAASGVGYNGVLNLTPTGEIYYYVSNVTTEVGVYCGNLTYFV